MATSGELAGRVLSRCGVDGTVSREQAIEVLSSTLAVVLKLSDRTVLDDLESVQGFPGANLAFLPAEERGFLQAEIDLRIEEINGSEIARLQERVQTMLVPTARKRLAAYYTKPHAARLMGEMAVLHRDAHRGRRLIVADPFLGSGLTLTAAIERMGEASVAEAWGVEPNLLSALCAYAALLYRLGRDPRRVHVRIGDAFRIVGFEAGSSSTKGEAGTFPGADVILTNPPFTRWELLKDEYRALLRGAVDNSRYGHLVTRRQLNLQIAAVFLLDHVLRPGGLLVSVLPASTFYTIAGVAVKRLLREGYTVHALAESLSEASFSTDSGFKEIILAATKGRPQRTQATAFVSLHNGFDPSIAARAAVMEGEFQAATHSNLSIHRAELNGLPATWEMNWLAQFGNDPLRRILEGILTAGEKRGLVGVWAHLFGRGTMVRGVEMYGPNFFLLPNDRWGIAEDEKTELRITRLQGDQSLCLPKRFLVACLRKPTLYSERVRVEPSHYFLSLPPLDVSAFPADVAEYVDWGSRSAEAGPAMKAFGPQWYAHVYSQLGVKRPYGQLFLPDKVDPSFKNRGVFANYTDCAVTASKNFYIVRSNEEEGYKILATWFNSGLFLSLLLLVGRRLSATWTRFLEDDYLKLPVINVRGLSSSRKNRILVALERLVGSEPLPPLKEQLSTECRLRLDSAVLEAIGVPEPDRAARQMNSVIGDRLAGRTA